MTNFCIQENRSKHVRWKEPLEEVKVFDHNTVDEERVAACEGLTDRRPSRSVPPVSPSAPAQNILKDSISQGRENSVPIRANGYPLAFAHLLASAGPVGSASPASFAPPPSLVGQRTTPVRLPPTAGPAASIRRVPPDSNPHQAPRPTRAARLSPGYATPTPADCYGHSARPVPETQTPFVRVQQSRAGVHIYVELMQGTHITIHPRVIRGADCARQPARSGQGDPVTVAYAMGAAPSTRALMSNERMAMNGRQSVPVLQTTAIGPQMVAVARSTPQALLGYESSLYRV
ncbi:hypothetical protein DACRYDRAFT_107008 [Dacryopinax primogenitus]|uniref:Uncharacterized protein n=1 Tax=Dacryopinax primogenitus (strain DJM 731) TaxID=1858805 RepID=M5G3Y8_DACPD|nr:uncharacterized protein DACRYDRAFT_107008 [Dacryopinax primogenitus]EJU02925.1 hypothetical protein DACRYDRAFT_107008 [Dacryopinax primogenitus]